MLRVGQSVARLLAMDLRRVLRRRPARLALALDGLDPILKLAETVRHVVVGNVEALTSSSWHENVRLDCSLSWLIRSSQVRALVRVEYFLALLYHAL